MNKEILFKAKRVDTGEWVEGFYAFIGGKDVIIVKEPENFYPFEGDEKSQGNEVTEVDPSTICRCTGKEYMDCETAYEGDIFESQSCGVKMTLRYGTYQAYCPADDCYMDNVGFYAEAEGYPQMPIGDLKDYALKIGNIFDNPGI